MSKYVGGLPGTEIETGPDHMWEGCPDTIIESHGDDPYEGKKQNQKPVVSRRNVIRLYYVSICHQIKLNIKKDPQ